MAGTPQQESVKRVLATRAALAPVGVSMPTLGPTDVFPMPQQLAGVRRLEKAGYRSAWAREGVGGHDALVEIAALLGATADMVIGSAVANMWARPAVTLHAASAVLGEAFPGRFVLGLGPGMAFHAEALGQRYERPYSLMRDYLEQMTAPSPVLPAAPQCYPRILAANGPRMVALAAASADGVHPGMIPPGHTVTVREAIGPDKLLVVGLPVVAMPDRRAARKAAGEFLAQVLTFAGSPYGASLMRLGYSAQELASGTGAVVDAVMGFGGPDDIAAKAREHLAAGADQVLVSSAIPGYDQGIEDFEWLAPALTALTA